jgi:GMP synthase (glutamine-hydrolysing)
MKGLPSGNKKMLMACLQHVSFEGPGHIARWAASRGHSLRIIRLYEGEALPRADEFDLLVAMGGPMSIHDETDYAWLVPEKRLIAQCLERDKFVLGVCLGSQLLANAFGSRVYRNRVREIGWFPIRWRQEANHSPCLAGITERMNVLHWHGETYDLPPGCVHLAESDGCFIQAFEHSSALGLQFHLELTLEALQDLTRNCGHEIGSGCYEQSPQRIISGESLHGEAARVTLAGILDGIERRIGNAPSR